jgi:hypothetical protein
MIDFAPTLSTAYKRLLNYIEVIPAIPSQDWNPIHSLAYICFKYKEKFNTDFVLSYNDSPSRSTDYKLTARIWLFLRAKSGDGTLLKDYIDWFYANYNGKRRFTSIGALAKVENIAAYNTYLSNKAIIKTTTPLPSKYLDILSKYDSTSYVKTYGDLYFLYESIKNDNAFEPIINDMIQNGFSFDSLKEVS